jgi:hypothetical protein
VSETHYAIAPGVPWVDAQDFRLAQPIAYVAANLTDPPRILEGAAWAIWTALVDGGTLVEVTRTAAELVGVEPADIAVDVETFVGRLVDDGAVVAHDGVTQAPSFVVDAFGVLVEVLPPDHRTRARWRRQWARGLVETHTPDVRLDARVVMEEADSSIDYKMSTRLTQRALDHSQGRLNLHAAGLVDEEGRAIALIAASGTGKTTATRLLGLRLGYLTDETVSVGPDLDVLPFPKPLSFVDDPRQPHYKSQLGPDELGLLPARLPATLRRIVLLDRRTRERELPPADVGLTRLSPAEAIAAILPQASYVTSLETPLLTLARTLQATGGAHVLRYAEIEEHLDDLVALLARPVEEEALDHGLVHHPGAAPAPPSPGTLGRAAWHDAVGLGDAVVVLVGAMSYQLVGLGATAWLALDVPRTEEELLAIARTVHGSHPEDVTLLRDALDSLVERDIVARGV